MGHKKDPRQLTLDGYFVVPPAVEAISGSCEFDNQWRRALNRAIKQSGKSRPRIAADMTELLFGDDGEREITKAMLDARTAPSRDAYAFPVTWLPAFIAATGAPWLLDVLAEKCGCKVLKGRQAILAQLGAAVLQERAAKRRMADVQKALPAGLYDELLSELVEAAK